MTVNGLKIYGEIPYFSMLFFDPLCYFSISTSNKISSAAKKALWTILMIFAWKYTAKLLSSWRYFMLIAFYIWYLKGRISTEWDIEYLLENIQRNSFPAVEIILRGHKSRAKSCNIMWSPYLISEKLRP